MAQELDAGMVPRVARRSCAAIEAAATSAGPRRLAAIGPPDAAGQPTGTMAVSLVFASPAYAWK